MTQKVKMKTYKKTKPQLIKAKTQDNLD